MPQKHDFFSHMEGKLSLSLTRLRRCWSSLSRSCFLCIDACLLFFHDNGVIHIHRVNSVFQCIPRNPLQVSHTFLGSSNCPLYLATDLRKGWWSSILLPCSNIQDQICLNPEKDNGDLLLLLWNLMPDLRCKMLALTYNAHHSCLKEVLTYVCIQWNTLNLLTR